MYNYHKQKNKNTSNLTCLLNYCNKNVMGFMSFSKQRVQCEFKAGLKPQAASQEFKQELQQILQKDVITDYSLKRL